jgi:hypothetical protein
MKVNLVLVYLKIDFTDTEKKVWYKQHKLTHFSQVWFEFYIE